MAKSSSIITEKLAAGTVEFVRELATYYMDFLETDFHRRREPRRSIKFRTPDNLLVGVALNRYPVFVQVVWSFIRAGFDKERLNRIVKGTHRTTISKPVFELIRLEVEKITEESLSSLRRAIGADVAEHAGINSGDYEKAFSEALEAVGARVRAEIVLPFVGRIKKPLERLELGDENTLYLIEEELRDLLLEPASSKISEHVRRLIAGQAPAVAEELAFAFSLAPVKRSLLEFFSSLAVGDLFSEVYELERNRSILENHEFYLYFGDIAYNGNKYPLFYIPFQVALTGDAFTLDFGAQVYVNKKALEFIVQEENGRTGKKGTLACTADRIIYLAQHESDFSLLVESVFSELTHFFQLDRVIHIADDAPQTAKSLSVRVTNSTYIALSSNADEALLNDYEQILQLLDAGAGTPVADGFCRLVDDFIHKDPVSVESEVEEEWDSTSVPDRLVYDSPIPLNSEQRQILLALHKERCKYVTVEGPPGTGKSHTITAIVCDAVLRNQSILVLSDKKEALDVVEDKITKTLNTVRTDRQFQNPILRLGNTGSTYAQILSTTVMEGIKTHYRAVKRQHEAVRQTIEQSSTALKEDVEAEALGYEDVSLAAIREWALLDQLYATNAPQIDVPELLKEEDSGTDLETLRTLGIALAQLEASLGDGDEVLQALGLGRTDTVEDFLRLLTTATGLEEALLRVEKAYPDVSSVLETLGECRSGDLPDLAAFIKNVSSLKKPLIGYLFTRGRLEAAERDFQTRLPYVSDVPPHKRLSQLQRFLQVGNLLGRETRRLQAALETDWFVLARLLLTTSEKRAMLRRLTALRDTVDQLPQFWKLYPSSLEKLHILRGNLHTITKNRLTDLPEAEFKSIVRYVTLTQEIRSAFAKIPAVGYSEDHTRIRDLVTLYMTFVMDGRVVAFYEERRNTAKALRDVIKSKQRFPQDEFNQIKEAFPCILAGIRDYAEYIPLEPEMFDLLIIDEASQVSIAQAFPALLRAKKILILGDKKQFSNVKAVQARSDTNRVYLNRISDCFRKHVASDPAKLVKLDRFNIRTSVLEFFEFISNYHIQLLKHFRGYKELISYSNKHFYRDALQVMKIRARAIDEVLQFTELSEPDKSYGARNINEAEIEFILKELIKLKDSGAQSSVGIITPHTDQQKALVDAVGRLPERQYLNDELKLKIMTFDTCQGEERDIIYYSLVATREVDRLWGVFIKDLASVDLEEDGKLKAQRLNVGFSRAKESMHFVVSKPLQDYKGGIGEALRHFANALNEAKKERSVDEVDDRSVMERQVLNWFYQTSLWKEQKDRLELIPQFELGKYLKQLDPQYSHPLYRVDFLLLYRPKSSPARTIVIEYDGFREHFGEGLGITAANFESYYSEEDIYRQKVLESYGYRFLRINRFNVGDNPVETLDTRLRHLLDACNAASHHHLLDRIHGDIEQLREGDLKECPKCRELRKKEEFKDASLSTGVGRFCRYCKGTHSRRTTKSKAAGPIVVGSSPCPSCGSKMVLRKGRLGRFYGCSRFPYCRGTRPAPTAIAGV